VDGLWGMKTEGVGLIVHAISFQDFQPVLLFLSFYLSACHRCFHVCLLAFWLPISNKLELELSGPDLPTSRTDRRMIATPCFAL